MAGLLGPDDEGLEGETLFQEPAGYFPPEKKPTFVTHKLNDGRELKLRLVGHNPLWGHHLWNGGRLLAAYLESHPSLVTGRKVLELGAGSGLPGLVAALYRASEVVITDYPDAELIENIEMNIAQVKQSHLSLSTLPLLHATGHLWGSPLPAAFGLPNSFSLLLLADLLFNHSEHNALADTIVQTLSKDAQAVALVFFTPYRPWLLEKDLDFLRVVREKGLVVVEKILEEKLDKVMFENDRGDEELRRTVFGYAVKWPVRNGSGKQK